MLDQQEQRPNLEAQTSRQRSQHAVDIARKIRLVSGERKRTAGREHGLGRGLEKRRVATSDDCEAPASARIAEEDAADQQDHCGHDDKPEDHAAIITASALFG